VFQGNIPERRGVFSIGAEENHGRLRAEAVVDESVVGNHPSVRDSAAAISSAMRLPGERAAQAWGRRAGLAVFFLGILLLLIVFAGTAGLPALTPPRNREASLADAIRVGLEIAKLFLSGLVASWIAARGAQLYGAATRAPGDE
jgi:hypothetical protein